MTGLEAKVYLLRVLPELDEVARLVAVRVVQRLEQGAKEHGSLAEKLGKRDWRRELREELLDALIYDATEQVEAERG